MKILIIEDEILILKSLKRLLERQGVQVITESAGRKAIEIIEKEKPDRIICDLMLHDITGFDVIESAKKTYSSREIAHKFIIITAYSSAQVLEKASEYGCLILEKPFEDMNQAIDIFLKKDPISREQ